MNVNNLPEIMTKPKVGVDGVIVQQVKEEEPEVDVDQSKIRY